MNDQQLIAMLRGLDGPAAPEPDFAATLYAVLERRVRPRRRASREVLLAAALLAAAAVGLAIAVGSELLRDGPVVVAPSEPPADTTYTVNVPDGAVTASTPEEVVAAARLFGSVESLTWVPEGTSFNLDGGQSEPLEGAAWVVVVVRSSERATFYLADGPLGVFFPEALPTPEPEPTLVPIPSWDPSVPLELVSDRGRTIRPTTVTLPGVDGTLRVGALTPVGDVAWAPVHDVASGEMRSLLRVDGRTGDASIVPIPAAPDIWGVVAGPDILWLRSRTADVLVLDPETGEVVGTLMTPASGDLIGVTEDGLWFREPALNGNQAGAVLVDPATGAVVRRIATPETEGPYRGFWYSPAFGSLWDLDRSRGVVLRVDAVTGAVQAEIDLTLVIDADRAKGCGDPAAGAAGVEDLEGFVTAFCGEAGDVVIDPATNTVARIVPFQPGFNPAFVGTGIGGQLWVTSQPGLAPDDWGQSLVHVDPATGMALETLALNRERLTLSPAAVLGDDVWLVVGEQAHDADPYRQNQVLVRIPVSELTG